MSHSTHASPLSGEPEPEYPTITILIAEADPLLRGLLAQLLAGEGGFEVIASAATVQESIETIGRRCPQVLLLDPQLGGCLGAQTLERLVDLPAAPAVLVLSDHESEEAQLEAARGGARGFLAKSQALSHLPEAIRAVARGEIWYGPRIAERVFAEYRLLVRQASERPANRLTEREREVLVHLARGLTNNQIASDLYISVHSVKLDVQHIFRKLNLPNRTEAAVFAVREGLLDSSTGHAQ